MWLRRFRPVLQEDRFDTPHWHSRQQTASSLPVVIYLNVHTDSSSRKLDSHGNCNIRSSAPRQTRMCCSWRTEPLPVWFMLKMTRSFSEVSHHRLCKVFSFNTVQSCRVVAPPVILTQRFSCLSDSLPFINPSTEMWTTARLLTPLLTVVVHKTTTFLIISQLICCSLLMTSQLLLNAQWIHSDYCLLGPDESRIDALYSLIYSYVCYENIFGFFSDRMTYIL